MDIEEIDTSDWISIFEMCSDNTTEQKLRKDLLQTYKNKKKHLTKLLKLGRTGVGKKKGFSNINLHICKVELFSNSYKYFIFFLNFFSFKQISFKQNDIYRWRTISSSL